MTRRHARAGRALEIEEGLRQARGECLQEHPVPRKISPEGGRPPDFDPDWGADEVQAALRAAAAREWTLNAFGRSYDAAEQLQPNGITAASQA